MSRRFVSVVATLLTVVVAGGCTPESGTPSPEPSASASPSLSSPSPTSATRTIRPTASSKPTTELAPGVDLGKNPPKDLTGIKNLSRASLPKEFKGMKEGSFAVRGSLGDLIMYESATRIVTVHLAKDNPSYRIGADKLRDVTSFGRVVCGTSTTTDVLTCAIPGTDGSGLFYSSADDEPVERLVADINELYDSI